MLNLKLVLYDLNNPNNSRNLAQTSLQRES